MAQVDADTPASTQRGSDDDTTPPTDRRRASPLKPSAASESVTPRRVQASRNVYIASLPLRFTSDDLYRLASPYGRIESLRMFNRNRHVEVTGHSYGFVLYTSTQEAENAVSALANQPLGDRLLQVRLSRGGISHRAGRQPPGRGQGRGTPTLVPRQSPPTQRRGTPPQAVNATFVSHAAPRQQVPVAAIPAGYVASADPGLQPIVYFAAQPTPFGLWTGAPPPAPDRKSVV